MLLSGNPIAQAQISYYTIKKILYTVDYSLYYFVAVAFYNYIRVHIRDMKQDKEEPPFKNKWMKILLMWGIFITCMFGFFINQSDIEVSDFCIPSLSVQPLVENAVKHGIRMKKGGGTVRVQTKELTDEYQIIISDDGAGYEVGTVPADGRSHIGIENIKKRLYLICKGYCEIKSEIGKGTIAIVHIPK